MAKLAKRLSVLVFLVTLSCNTTNTVKFDTKTKATISVVKWNELDRQGKELGETPREVELDEIKDQIVKITAPGKTPQFWVFSEPTGQKFEAQLVLTDVSAAASEGGGGAGSVSGFDINETHRLLMKSYQSLASGDLAAATDLAKKLNEIEPRLAAPLIIIGLASLQNGNKEEARLAFDKARSLDPRDGEIDKLIQAAQ